MESDILEYLTGLCTTVGANATSRSITPPPILVCASPNLSFPEDPYLFIVVDAEKGMVDQGN